MKKIRSILSIIAGIAAGIATSCSSDAASGSKSTAVKVTGQPHRATERWNHANGQICSLDSQYRHAYMGTVNKVHVRVGQKGG